MGNWRETKGLTARQALDMPPLWLLGALILVWMTANLLPGLTHRFLLAQLAGTALCLGGIALMVWALITFRSHQTSVVPHQMPLRIITTGPFAHSRNPIYLGDVMILTGAVLWWGAWPGLLLIPIFTSILVRRFIASEEARMKQNFGAEFDAFAKKAPRWL